MTAKSRGLSVVNNSQRRSCAPCPCSGRVCWRHNTTTALGCAGASEPRQLGYMVRLGLWGPGQPAFADFPAFLDALGHRGVGALELVGCSLCIVPVICVPDYLQGPPTTLQRSHGLLQPSTVRGGAGCICQLQLHLVKSLHLRAALN